MATAVTTFHSVQVDIALPNADLLTHCAMLCYRLQMVIAVTASG